MPSMDIRVPSGSSTSPDKPKGHGWILEVSHRAKILMGINRTNYSSKDEDR